MSNHVLFDLPSKDPCKCWSLNPWKTRMLLNYKQIPYETKWLEYPEIRPTIEKHVQAHDLSTGVAYMSYTIPTIMFPDGIYLQDSRKIAERIEHENPSPNLHLNSELTTKVAELAPKIQKTIMPDIVAKIPDRLLNEASVPYWHETRSKRFSMPLDQVQQELGGDSPYMEAAPLIQEMSKLLQKNTGGPFFEGTQITYADFIWASFLRFMHRVGEDVLVKVLEVSGDREAHVALYSACQPWLSRDDH